ncbi:hypothetical protein Taro_007739 [Colocasia esculenta]|uniref:Secreted protein n=1 Tax=Colocasia esculenta TaxID=4460 RepID=A0A843TV28_COLES|nr:hypothetical protein [Colocasia esculenta]
MALIICMCATCWVLGDLQTSADGKATLSSVAIRSRRDDTSWVGVFSSREARVKWKKRRGIAVLRILCGGSTMPTVVTSLVGCPRFSVSQAVSSGLVPRMVIRGEDPRLGFLPVKATEPPVAI